MKIRNQLIVGISIIILLTISMFTYNFNIGKKIIKSISLIENQTDDVSHAKEVVFLLSVICQKKAKKMQNMHLFFYKLYINIPAAIPTFNDSALP